jgi:hypothetical protein
VRTVISRSWDGNLEGCETGEIMGARFVQEQAWDVPLVPGVMLLDCGSLLLRLIRLCHICPSSSAPCVQVFRVESPEGLRRANITRDMWTGKTSRCQDLVVAL